MEGAGFRSDPPKPVGIAKWISINEVRREDCTNKEIFKQREQVRRFLIQLEWVDEGDGITWLELHILFRLHGGSVAPECKEAAPGLDSPTCSQNMKAFKAAVRWTATHNFRNEDEWLLQTSYPR